MTTKFKILLQTHLIDGTSNQSPEEFLNEVEWAFKANRKKGDLFQITSTKGIQRINLSYMQLVEAWEE